MWESTRATFTTVRPPQLYDRRLMLDLLARGKRSVLHVLLYGRLSVLSLIVRGVDGLLYIWHTVSLTGVGERTSTTSMCIRRWLVPHCNTASVRKPSCYLSWCVKDNYRSHHRCLKVTSTITNHIWKATNGTSTGVQKRLVKRSTSSGVNEDD
jgi:hypothetical protein